MILLLESAGNAGSARVAYQRVLTHISPGLIEAVVQAASFERRQQSPAAARSIYESSLAAAESKEGEGHASITSNVDTSLSQGLCKLREPCFAGSVDSAAMLAMFYAQFLHLDLGDAAAARVVYQKALARAPGLRYLWEAAIHFEEYCLEPGRAGEPIVFESF